MTSTPPSSTKRSSQRGPAKKGGSRDRGSDRRGTMILVGAGLAMLAILVAVVLLTGGDDEPSGGGNETALEYGAVDLQDDPELPPFASTEGDQAIGKTAPRAEGVEFADNPATLLNAGRPTMLVFAAHWCPHCQREIPLIVDWMADGGTQGLDVTLVATGTDPANPNYPPSDWLAREGWTGRVLLDDQDGTLAAAYGLDGYPFIVFVDGDGKVTRRASGEIPIDTLRTWATEAGAGA